VADFIQEKRQAAGALFSFLFGIQVMGISFPGGSYPKMATVRAELG
jgi:hypothetical protein